MNESEVAKLLERAFGELGVAAEVGMQKLSAYYFAQAVGQAVG